MQVRFNKALKLTALLLLTLEFMAPADLMAKNAGDEEKVQVVSAEPFQNPLFSAFIEELCENEEGKEEINDFLTGGDFVLPINNLFRIIPVDPTAFITSLLQFGTHPPLFRLLCKLVI